MGKRFTATSLSVMFTLVCGLPAVAEASPEIGETSAGVFSRLATPATVRGTNVGDIVLTDVNGNLLFRCTSGQMDATLNTNSGTEIRISIEGLSISGTGSNESCTGTFGSFKWTTTVGNGVPYCFAAGGKLGADEFQMRGNSCANASRSITFVHDTSFGECRYERVASIKGNFATDISGQQGTLSITREEIPAEAGNPFACLSLFYLDMSFRLETSDGSALYLK